MMKEIKALKADISKLSKQNKKVERRRKKLATRAIEEAEMSKNLKQICK